MAQSLTYTSKSDGGNVDNYELRNVDHLNEGLTRRTGEFQHTRNRKGRNRSLAFELETYSYREKYDSLQD